MDVKCRIELDTGHDQYDNANSTFQCRIEHDTDNAEWQINHEAGYDLLRIHHEITHDRLPIDLGQLRIDHDTWHDQCFINHDIGNYLVSSPPINYKTIQYNIMQSTTVQSYLIISN